MLKWSLPFNKYITILIQYKDRLAAANANANLLTSNEKCRPNWETFIIAFTGIPLHPLREPSSAVQRTT